MAINLTITTDIQKKFDIIVNAIKQSTTLELIYKSPEYPLILGRSFQRTIDLQQFKPLTKRYKLYKDRKYGVKPILIRTGILYKNYGLGKGFSSQLENANQSIRIIPSKETSWQQRLGRNPLLLDKRGQKELVDLTSKEIGKDNYPPLHPHNIDNGTADEFMWKVYGLGLRGAMRGVIFPSIVWIDQFPEDMAYIHANDFGFTTDPNVLVKYAENTTSIFIEPLSYEPIETPEALAAYFDAIGIDKKLPLPCDSADKYTGQQGTVEMVTGLRRQGYFNAFKISKTKTVMFWLNSMKTKKVHIVRNHLYKHAKVEAENYRIREINGTPINEPLDQFNHMWDAARYGHIAYNNPAHTHTTKKSLSELGIDF